MGRKRSTLEDSLGAGVHKPPRRTRPVMLREPILTAMRDYCKSRGLIVSLAIEHAIVLWLDRRGAFGRAKDPHLKKISWLSEEVKNREKRSRNTSRRKGRPEDYYPGIGSQRAARAHPDRPGRVDRGAGPPAEQHLDPSTPGDLPDDEGGDRGC